METTQRPQLAVGLKEAARMLDVSAKTVSREIARGNLRALKIGKLWKIRVVELDSYLKRRERKQGA